MAYITISNSKKLIRKLDEIKLDGISESIYKWDIYFFSKRESANLKGIRELFRNPEKFLVEYYKPIEAKESFRYLSPETQPAYHKDSSCERLKSNFRSIEVPLEIQNKGKEEVLKFRGWYNSMTFDADNPKDYIYKLQLEFKYIGEINPKSIDYTNSGVEEKENYSLEEIENKIDTVLRDASNYFKSNPHLQNIIRRYQKWTFLAYVYNDIYNNESELTSEELKAFLLDYDKNFKAPVKNLLIEYYRIKFNPNLTFDGNILIKLGFRPCESCLRNNNYVHFSPATTNETCEPLDELLF